MRLKMRSLRWQVGTVVAVHRFIRRGRVFCSFVLLWGSGRVIVRGSLVGYGSLVIICQLHHAHARWHGCGAVELCSDFFQCEAVQAADYDQNDMQDQSKCCYDDAYDVRRGEGSGLKSCGLIGVAGGNCCGRCGC